MMQNPVDPAAPAAYEECEAKPMMNLATLPPAVSFHRLFPAIRPGREVQNEVKKPAQFKVGIVTVTEGRTPTRGEAYFELRYVDPPTGKDVKRRVSGLELDEIKDMAHNLTRRAYTGKGYLAEQPKAPGIEEGLLEAIQLANTGRATRLQRIYEAERFVAWLATNYETVRTWDQLRPAMLQRYVVELERAGKAFDTIRLSVAPVKLAWRVMHDNYPELVRPLPKIKQAAPPRREIECLDAGELASLLGWLKAHAADVYPMACLQGLAGLRMFEAAALRVQDVDLKAGTVTITVTGHHTPKTRDSYRTIPVCGEVLDALKSAIARQKVRPATGEIFTNERGNLWVKNALTLRWYRILNHASATPKVIKREKTGKRLTINPHGLSMPRLGEIPARKLRAAFATLASKLGAQDRIVKAYIGHSAGDVLGEHYRRIEMDELRTVSSLMDGWREVAETSTLRKDSGNTGVSQVAEG